jgi:hypothetical protein
VASHAFLLENRLSFGGSLREAGSLSQKYRARHQDGRQAERREKFQED